MDIAGGASTARQALLAGVVDELTLDFAPVLLGGGERLFDGVDTFGFTPVEVVTSPGRRTSATGATPEVRGVLRCAGGVRCAGGGGTG